MERSENSDRHSKFENQTSQTGTKTAINHQGLRVRNIKPPTLPTAMKDQPLTEKQIQAFSKESLLKPVLTQHKLVPMPPSSQLRFEEEKESKNEHIIKVGRIKTAQSASSSSTISSL